MHQLLESFLAEDNTGNQYRIERFEMHCRDNRGNTRRSDLLQHKNRHVIDLGEDLYYIESIDTEVRKI